LLEGTKGSNEEAGTQGETQKNGKKKKNRGLRSERDALRRVE